MKNNYQSTIIILARILLAAIFIIAGLGKTEALEATRGYMEAMGVPGILLWPAIVLEIGGGLLVILGFYTRISALTLAAFCLVSGVIFHHDFAVPAEMISFLKNLGMAGGFLLLVCTGAGVFSIDARRNT